jgi:PAS domain S-box-containing protein
MNGSEISLPIEAILASESCPCILYDRNGRIVAANGKYKEMFHGTAPPPEFSFFDDPHIKRFGLQSKFQNLMNGRTEIIEEMPFNPRDINPDFPDIPLVVNFTIFPIPINRKNPDYFFFIMHDATGLAASEKKLRESEERFSAFITKSAFTYVELALDGRVTFCNEPAAGVMGYKLDEMIGMNIREGVHPDDFPRMASNLAKIRKGEFLGPSVFRFIPKNGGIVYFECTTLPLVKEGETVGFQTTALNVTHRMHTEEALKKSETELRVLLDTAPYGIIQTDVKGAITYWNEAYRAIYGYTPEEMSRRTAWDFLPPDFVDKIKKIYVSLLDTMPKPEPLRLQNQTKDGSRIDIQAVWNYVRAADGSLSGFIIIVTDITEKLASEKKIFEYNRDLEELVRERTFDLTNTNELLGQAVRQLTESEEKYRALVENASDFIFGLTKDGNYVSANMAAARAVGLAPEELIGRNLTDVFPRDLADSFLSSVQLIFQTGTPSTDRENPVILPNGKIWVQTSLNPVRDKDGNIECVLGIARDITARKAAEDALRESEEKFRTLVECANDGIAILQNNVIKYVNPRFVQMIGASIDEIIGQPFIQQIAPESKKIVQERYERRIAGNDKPARYEAAFFVRSGAKINAEFTTTLIAYQGKPAALIFVHDITERKANEAQLLDYQKELRNLATQLSMAEEAQRRSIAEQLHDRLGQTLALCKIKLGSLLSSTDDKTAKKEIGEILRHTEEAIDSTRALTFELSPPVLYELGLLPALESLADQFGKEHKIRCKVEAEPITSGIHPRIGVVLFRAVRELLVNAAKHSCAKRIRIGVSEKYDAFVISVEDDGIGFTAEALQSGSGSKKGFGLFSIRERLGQLGGSMEIDSTPGKGARITLSIPASLIRANNKEDTA